MIGCNNQSIDYFVADKGTWILICRPLQRLQRDPLSLSLSSFLSLPYFSPSLPALTTLCYPGFPIKTKK